MQKIYTESAPQAIGPYSQAIVSGNFVFTSGQLGIIPETGCFAEGGIKEQTEQSCKNLNAVLKEAGTSLDKAVKTVCFLKDIKDFAQFNEIYEKYFTQKPARSCVQAAALPKDALVEIEVIAEK